MIRLILLLMISSVAFGQRTPGSNTLPTLAEVIASRAAPGANTDITSLRLNQSGLVVKGGNSNALTIRPDETMTGERQLNIRVNDANRLFSLFGDFIKSGSHSLTLTTTATTDITLPTTGTLSVIPSGGTTGQVLKKNSNTNYDYVWGTDNGGSAAWGSITGTLSSQTDLQTALDAKAPLASPTFTGTPAAPTAATGTNTTQLATTAFVQSASNNNTYRTIAEAQSSHIAARAAGTYWLANGEAAGVTGTGTLYPPNVIYIDANDYPTVDGKATDLRIRVQLYTNDVAPTGNYTFGLYPVTRPGTSGGAGVATYTMGTVVASSTVLFTAPAADGLHVGVSAEFAVPATGHYVIGFINTITPVANSHMHMKATLQMRNN